MKKLIAALILLNYQLLPAISQTAYWQQQVNYLIDVSLNDKEHTLDGFEKIEYSNHSPDTLRFIWFHLWPNAYKNDKTAFTDQQLENGNTKFYFSGKEDKGYINRLDFKVDNITAETEDHPEHIDIVKLILPAPVAPGQTVLISTPFHVKLPYNFSRGGHVGQSYQATQWYPKPAVYDSRGWHPVPYLDQGEFYSDFGNFDVRITLPENYAVAATGELQDQSEKEWLAGRKNFTWKPFTRRYKSKSGINKKVTQEFPVSAAKTKTIRFTQNNVHDFAWFADKRFIVKQDTCLLSSGKIINVSSYYTRRDVRQWEKTVRYSKDAIRFYSSQVGEYPYNTATVVQGPKGVGNGMEYPTITLISPARTDISLDHVVAHELGHNWFYGILASDERNHPWMDEGLNSFYNDKYNNTKYKLDTVNQSNPLFQTKAVTKTDQPIEGNAEKFSFANYALVVYYKTSEWMRWMESSLGNDVFAKAMQDYYTEWQFKHPQPADFKASLEKSTGRNLDSFFAYIDKPGLLPNQTRKGTSVGLIFQKNHFNKLVNNTAPATNNLITISPALGFNSYDKLMAGIFITNYKLPPTKFRFFLAPMYATGSKAFTGTGTLNYSFYPENNLFRRVDLFLNGAKFNSDYFTDSLNKKHYTGFEKLVPGLRIVLKEKNPRSTVYSFIQWKTFLITEQKRDYTKDTTIAGADTTVLDPYSIYKERRTLNQLRFVYENNRALYPFQIDLNAEHGAGFLRFALTGNYFLNYSAKRSGVLLRYFFGKFIYLNREKANAALYGVSLAAPKGDKDYTYSDYFLGRNSYPFIEGRDWTFAYQQIMIRDGGFKINNEVQGNTGFSDNWVAVVNTSFDIFPGRTFIKIFADIGTSAEFWKKGAGSDRFVYDAGLQLSLFKNLINIYVPVLYSPVYKEYLKADYIGEHKFLKSISFSIDMANFNLRKINRNLVF